jgi:hypothetical protein
MPLADGGVPLLGRVVRDLSALGLMGGIHKSNNYFASERMGDSFNNTDGGASHTLPLFKVTQFRLINTRLRIPYCDRSLR